MVDRRDAPGGHWQDAYPYVRLHQPSAFYGVSSVPLGQDAIDAVGLNAGFYELAGPDELRAYYERVMNRHFLPTGRVRYFPNCEYVGEHRFISRVAERRGKCACTASWSTRRISRAPSRRRIRPRSRWQTAFAASLQGRYSHQRPPRALRDHRRGQDGPRRRHVALRARCSRVGDLLDQTAGSLVVEPQVSAAVHHARRTSIGAPRSRLRPSPSATSVADLVARLESEAIFVRVDPDVTPTMFRGAVVSEPELALLRQINDVVRLGRVRRIEKGAIVLDEGRVPTSERTLHVHCASRALARRPLRRIFEAKRVTVQPVLWGFACYQFAMLGVVEATIESDEEKNRFVHPSRIGMRTRITSSHFWHD